MDRLFCYPRNCNIEDQTLNLYLKPDLGDRTYVCWKQDCLKMCVDLENILLFPNGMTKSCSKLVDGWLSLKLEYQESHWFEREILVGKSCISTGTTEVLIQNRDSYLSAPLGVMALDSLVFNKFGLIYVYASIQCA